MNQREQREMAERRMAEAKRQFSAAARAALAGDPNAPAMAQAAFRDVNAARAELEGAPESSTPDETTGQ